MVCGWPLKRAVFALSWPTTMNVVITAACAAQQGRGGAGAGPEAYLSSLLTLPYP